MIPPAKVCRRWRHDYLAWRWAWRSYYWRYCTKCGTRQEKITDISWRTKTYPGYYGPNAAFLPGAVTWIQLLTGDSAEPTPWAASITRPGQ